MKKNNKKIYIILTQTYTIIARIISIISKNKYSHVSIGFDEECNVMYSFGRKYNKIAFIGVFKKENINKGLFIKNKNSLMALYELNISTYQYKEIQKKIEEIKNNNKGYNILGLLLAIIKIKLNRDKYYCSEFVSEILSSDKINIMENTKKIIKPEDFKNIKGLKLVYEGKVSDFTKKVEASA